MSGERAAEGAFVGPTIVDGAAPPCGFRHDVAGMIGVNIEVATPVAFFPFSG